MGSADVVFGRVVAVHIDDAVIDARGRVDILKIRPIARMGYYDYTVVDNLFEMAIGGDDAALLAGLEGSAEKAAVASPGAAGGLIAARAGQRQPRRVAPGGLAQRTAKTAKVRHDPWQLCVDS
jgi:hypothetical protein